MKKLSRIISCFVVTLCCSPAFRRRLSPSSRSLARPGVAMDQHNEQHGPGGRYESPVFLPLASLRWYPPRFSMLSTVLIRATGRFMCRRTHRTALRHGQQPLKQLM